MLFHLETTDYVTRYKLLTGLVVPRPIAWVSTLASDGTANLAPFSFFNLVATSPPILMVSVASRLPDAALKDTVRNIRQTGVFVVNTVPTYLLEPAVLTSTELAPEVDEFELAGLTMVATSYVKGVAVAESPVNLECSLRNIIEIPHEDPAYINSLILGDIVAANVRDEIYKEGKVIYGEHLPVGRIAGPTYAFLEKFVTLRQRDLFPGSPELQDQSRS